LELKVNGGIYFLRFNSVFLENFLSFFFLTDESFSLCLLDCQRWESLFN